jgi:hypothetical protein
MKNTLLTLKLAAAFLLGGASCLWSTPPTSAVRQNEAITNPTNRLPTAAPLAYQVDDVGTSVVSGRDGKAWLRISARGWAPHAGYGNPRLVPAKGQPGPHVLRLRFLIDPPESDGFWPMVLTEVQAVALLPLQQQKRVRVRGFANSAVAPIDPQTPVFPSAWGKPPTRQTKDWRRLPGKYGFGSSTLAHWIKRNQQKR